MNLPSKELLSKVIEEDILRIGSLMNTTLEIEVKRYSYNEWVRYSIYELMFLMKEWILKQELEIDTHTSAGSYEVELIGQCDNSDEFGCLKYSANASTEFETVTKACEWKLRDM